MGLPHCFPSGSLTISQNTMPPHTFLQFLQDPEGNRVIRFLCRASGIACHHDGMYQSLMLTVLFHFPTTKPGTEVCRETHHDAQQWMVELAYCRVATIPPYIRSHSGEP